VHVEAVSILDEENALNKKSVKIDCPAAKKGRKSEWRVREVNTACDEYINGDLLLHLSPCSNNQR
jgi:hypothetical protein